MITIKTDQEIKTLREGGKRLAAVLEALKSSVSPGVSLADLDKKANELMTKDGDRPAFLNYKPHGAKRPYPSSVCISLNDEVVHGIPSESKRVIKEGDVVTIDGGLVHKGLFTDSAVTISVGKVSNEVKNMISAAYEALRVGIEAAEPGATIGDIGHAIESFIKPYKFGIIRELSGHGVGYKVHEDPYVPNYGKSGTGEKLKPGMVLAIEPMLTLGGEGIILDNDGYTVRTKDGSLSVHVEHTIVITENGAEILTSL